MTRKCNADSFAILQIQLYRFCSWFKRIMSHNTWSPSHHDPFFLSPLGPSLNPVTCEFPHPPVLGLVLSSFWSWAGRISFGV